MWKPGDKFERLVINTRLCHRKGVTYIVKGVYRDHVMDTNGGIHDLDRIRKTLPVTKDVQQLVDDVSTGRIQRGGVQGKFVVYTNDVGDTIIQLFKQRKD